MQIEKKCTQCALPFIAYRTDKEFCTDICRYRFHNRIKMAKIAFANQQGFGEIKVEYDFFVCSEEK